MTGSDGGAWLAIAVMAAVTLATRLLGPALMLGIAPSPRLVRFLHAMSLSVVAAIVATFLARGGPREAAAIAAAAAAAMLGRSPVAAIATGAAVAAIWARVAS